MLTPIRVTCVVTAYNYGHYIGRALDSILAQDYPQELIEIVVVDDGSTDDTPGAVQPYLDRIHYIRKENGGLNSAYERGLGEATGDAIAFLDADDEWPPDKLSRQVAVLRERPEVGLVYGDLEVIDADGKHVHPSYLRLHRIRPRRGAILGTLIHDNVVTGGSAMVRAEIAKARLPIPDWVAFPDWWVALGAAEVSDIEYVPASVYRYRLHGSNMGFGVDPRVRLVGPVRERELPFRRELLVRLRSGAVPAAELLVAYRRFTSDWHAVAQALDADVRTLIPVSPERRARAAGACAEAVELLGRGRTDEAVARAVAALAEDPWDTNADAVLSSLVPLIGHESPVATATLEAKSFAVGVRGRDLVDDPRLADGFFAEFSGRDDVTLVVYGDEVELAEAVDILTPTLDRLGEHAADAVAVALPGDAPAERALAARLDAALGSRVRLGAFRALPQLSADRVAELRLLADRPTATRILLAVESFHPAGADDDTAGLAAEIGTALRLLGCEAQVVTATLAQRTELSHGDLEILEVEPARASAELARLVADGTVDIVVGLGTPLSWPVLATLELSRPGIRRVVLPLADEEALAGILGEPAFAERYRRLLATVDLVLCMSNTGPEAQLVRAFGISATTAADPTGVAAAALAVDSERLDSERRAA